MSLINWECQLYRVFRQVRQNKDKPVLNLLISTNKSVRVPTFTEIVLLVLVSVLLRLRYSGSEDDGGKQLLLGGVDHGARVLECLDVLLRLVLGSCMLC